MNRKAFDVKHIEWKAVLAVGGLYLLLAVTGHGCPIRWITGVPCPGCGLSRAYLALLGCDIGQAFAFHPLFWAVPLIIGSAFWWERKGSRWAGNLTIILGAVFLLVYAGRLILGDPYMEIRADQGLIVRLVIMLKEILANK